MGSKKIKLNETELIPQNHYHHKYPLQDHFFSNPNNEYMPMSRENYRGFLFNLAGIN